MEEKLRLELDRVLACVARHTGDYPDEDDAVRVIEQAFLDAGWRPLQEPAKKSFDLRNTTTDAASFVVRLAALQPTEGELVPIPNKYNAQFDYDRWAAFDEGRQAQLAHDKARLKEPLFDSIEQQHIVQSLQAHYGAGWCVVCDSIMGKLTRIQLPIKEPPSVEWLRKTILRQSAILGEPNVVYPVNVSLLHEALKAYYGEQP